MGEKAVIRAIEASRYAAMIAGDPRVLGDLLDVDLAYTHSDGSRDTRDSYLAKVANGHFIYRQIEAPVESINVFGDTAIIVGRMVAEVLVKGDPRRLVNANLSVYRRRGEVWRLVAYQPTPLRTD